MTPERWLHLDQLLDKALELPVAERPAFVERMCIDDREMRHELQSLLAAHQDVDPDFLQTPALEVIAQHHVLPEADSLLGQTLSHYNVVSVLGVGGMGEVYQARDILLDRHVALKILPPLYTQDAGRIARFEREARTASALNHPNIITIFEIGQIENRHFIVTEYIDGRTLRNVIDRERVTEKNAIDIGIQICSALAAAHDAGIVHRDVKPENIMLRRDGIIKVLDFGLAKLTEQHRSGSDRNLAHTDNAPTNPGTVLGTARYMSPEQALGRDVDHRSDIFSLGVTLYELLGGLPPFKADQIAGVLDAIVHYHPIPLSEVRKDLHPELDHIIGRVLEKDRELRYQTAGDLRADLKRLQRELDSAARSHSSHSSGRFAGRQRRARKAKVLATVLGATAALIAAFFIWRGFTPDETPSDINWSEAKYVSLTDFPGREGNASISSDGQWFVYGRQVNGQWEVFRQRTGGSNATNLTNHPASDGDPAISPDNQHIAFYSARDGGGIFVMEATGENVRNIVREGREPDWSPDNKELVYGTAFGGNISSRRTLGSQIWAVNIASGAKRRIPAGPDAVQPKWSPNGHRIAYWGLLDSVQRDIFTVPASGGEPVAVTNDSHEDGSPVWAPDGRYLYYCSNRNGQLGVWRVAIDERTGRTLGKPELVPTQASFSHEMAMSGDGRRLIYTSRREVAQIYRAGFDAHRGTVIGDAVQITSGARLALGVSVSPDGQSIAYYTNSYPQFDIFVRKTDGSGTQQVTNDVHKDWSPRWSPDGKRLAFFSDTTGKYEIWTINPDGSDRKQETFSNQTQSGFVLPVWSPDGKRLTISLRHGHSLIMDLTRAWKEQTPLEFPPLPEGATTWFNGFHWSHDGQKIIGVAVSRERAVPGLVSYDLATQKYERITSEGDGPFWLNDNRRVAYGKGGRIFLVDVTTKQPRELSLPNLILDAPVLTRDERWIYFIGSSVEEDIRMITFK